MLSASSSPLPARGRPLGSLGNAEARPHPGPGELKSLAAPGEAGRAWPSSPH